jgi:hypothetical protein
MNYTRLVIAALVATIVDGAYGFLVWGKVLAGEFGRYPEIYRSGDDMSAFPLMFAAVFVGMLCASFIYAKGYEGGSSAVEGVKFGVIMGVFLAAYFAGVNYGTMRIGKKMALTYLMGGFGEWLLVGTAIGLVYKPAVAAMGKTSRASGV